MSTDVEDGIEYFNTVVIQPHRLVYSETLNNEHMERIHQMSNSSLSDNGIAVFSFLIKWLYGTL